MTLFIIISNLRGSIQHIEKQENIQASILIVEDEFSVRKMIVAGLAKRGHQIFTSENAEKALEFSRNHSNLIDLMLTDVIMPGMSGKELYNMLIKERPDMKVFFMSGYAENILTSHGIVQKGINFIAKPFTIKEMANKIENILSETS